MSTEMQTKVQAGRAQNFTPVQTGFLQRKCALCNTPGSGMIQTNLKINKRAVVVRDRWF